MVAPPKWVVPGRRNAWVDPTLTARPPAPTVDLRRVLAAALFVLALGLGALVLRLSRREDAAAPRRPVAAPARPTEGLYESEHVQMKFKPLPAETPTEESP